MHQGRCNSRVNSARETADHAVLAHLGAHGSDLIVDDRGHGPAWFAAGQIVQEPAQHLHAKRRVHHLWVELHTPDAALCAFERSHWCVRCRRRGDETGGRSNHRIEMAHPHVLLNR